MTIFAISDLHFDHTSCIYKFKEPDGSFMRGQFALGGPNPTEADREAATRWMNEHIIERINATVRPHDHLYIVGDVGMRRSSLSWVKRIACCHMTLIGGNHDIFKTKEYLAAGFKEVRGMRVMNNIAFTHVPIHPSCMSRWLGNAHGHIHRRPSPEGAYFNLSCEVLAYTPVALEEITLVLAAKNPDKVVREEEIARMKEAAEEIALLEADE